MKKVIYAWIAIIGFISACSNEPDGSVQNRDDINKENIPDKSIKFKAKTEEIVETGEVFQLVYEVNANVDNFSPPRFESIDVLSGPAISSYSSTQSINGKTTANITNSYTYTISCDTPGDITIPSAEVTIKGIVYKSDPVIIKVIGEKPKQSVNNQSEIKSTKEDIFIRAEYSKTSVYKGEWIVVTTKIYTKVDFQNISEVQFPDYTGFWTETLQAPRQIEFKNEQYNGEIYQSAILKQTLIFAQKPGKFTISPYEIELQLKKKDGKGKDFFGNIVDTYKLVNKKLSTGKQTIVVKPLPQPEPEGFSGITGNKFSIDAKLEPQQIKPDESTNLKLTISGIGNLYLLTDLPLTLPEGLKLFKPEIEKKNKTTENGPFSEYILNYIIVGNTPGNYQLEPFKFIYFDPEKEAYITTQSTGSKLRVDSDANYTPPTELVENDENRDIRFIKQNVNTISKKGNLFFGKPLYYLCFVVMTGLFLLILLIVKKRQERLSDVVNNRKRMAGKASLKRLKSAKDTLEAGHYKDFYKEILAAIWIYLGDKFTINKAHLTDKNVTEILKAREIPEETILKLNNIIEICGFAQYSPVGEDAQPQTVYQDTLDLLNEFEKRV